MLVDLTSVAHRPYPLPTGRPIMEMNWHDLLFAHWPVSVRALRRHIPKRLEIDTYDGHAWIGVVPFTMTGVRIRPLPGMPGATRFPEINVRTYVVDNGIPGVYFFSLDAGSLIAVKAARAWYHLPYFHARITSVCTDETVEYSSARIVRAGQESAQFHGSYRPLGPAAGGGCGPLAQWLTERYCLYTFSPRRHLYRADIHHALWPLQEAEAEIRTNTMTDSLDIQIPDEPPLLHFAKRLDVVAWRPVRLSPSRD